MNENKIPCPSCTFRGPVWLNEEQICVQCGELWSPDGTGWYWVWDVVPWEWWLENGMIEQSEMPTDNGPLTIAAGAGGEMGERG